jgi:hypothetical protein
MLYPIHTCKINLKKIKPYTKKLYIKNETIGNKVIGKCQYICGKNNNKGVEYRHDKKKYFDII